MSRLRPHLVQLLSITCMFLIVGVARGQTTWYVDDDAPGDPCLGDPNCSDPNENGSPEHPFDAIQEGINAAVNGDTVLVADGAYTGDGNRDMDFGGRLITVRGENGPATCVIDCQGVSGDTHRAFSFTSGESADAVLEGVTMQNGYVESDNGGAIYISNGDPTIRNCEFRDNTAIGGAVQHTGKGGAIFIGAGASGTIGACTFLGNRVEAGSVLKTGTGGAVALLDSAATITDSTFRNNMAVRIAAKGGHGGAIGTRISELTLDNCRFIDNLANFANGADGGAITCHSDPPDYWNAFWISNCLFVGNRATYEGGAIRNGKSGMLLINSVFAGNSVDNYGAAVFTAYPGPPLYGPAQMVNTVVAGNHAAGNGSAIGHFSGPTRELKILDCTVVHNAGDRGGISNASGSTTPGSLMTISNSIVWGNTPIQIVSNADADTTATYSDVQDGVGEPWFGAGCIDEDPQFESGASGAWTADASYDSETGQTTFFDDNASWPLSSLKGRFLNPDTSQVLQSVIVMNAGNSVTVWGDFAVLGLTGTSYEINTYHVQPPSPVIDAGDPNYVLAPGERDIDNQWRVWDGDDDGVWRVDMGADEYGSHCFGDLDGDNSIDLADLAGLLSHYGSTSGVTPLEGDTDLDGDVDLGDLAALLSVYGETCD